ncbi:MAG: NotI family restriction endonuclease [Candidatus Planktophila sp.]|nr:NotI family restriction endonuclease [Candidatus Planktophila sp.]
MNQPLGEVFGLMAEDTSPKAKLERESNNCPFSSNLCTKDKANDPLGVCSVRDVNQNLVITCPVRFKEDMIIAEEVSEFFFPGNDNWALIPEVRLDDIHGKSAGNIDLVIALLDEDRKIIDFGSVEIQAVYISGNVREPFKAFMKNPELFMEQPWKGNYYPRPDFLSSSRKRLIPQVAYKGGILQSWGKKQAIVIDKPFFETIPTFPTCLKEEADLAWFIYELHPNGENKFNLKLSKTIYCKFLDMIDIINTPQPALLEDFMTYLDGKLRRL